MPPYPFYWLKASISKNINFGIVFFHEALVLYDCVKILMFFYPIYAQYFIINRPGYIYNQVLVRTSNTYGAHLGAYYRQ